MALTVTSRGTFSGNAEGVTSSVSFSPTSNYTAGQTAVLCIAYDNSAVNGLDPYSSISDSNGNLWSPLVNVLRDPGISGAGLVLRAFSTDQSLGVLTTGDTVTITGSSNFTAYCGTFSEASGSVGSVSYVTGGSTSGSGTTATVTSSSITSGDLVIGATGIEDDGAITADSDTSNGTWSTHQTAFDAFYGDPDTLRMSSQAKVVTATATQTYNTSWTGTMDYAILWVQFTETIGGSFDPLGAMGFFGI